MNCTIIICNLVNSLLLILQVAHKKFFKLKLILLSFFLLEFSEKIEKVESDELSEEEKKKRKKVIYIYVCKRKRKDEQISM
jgi:hypothetical protein